MNGEIQKSMYAFFATYWKQLCNINTGSFPRYFLLAKRPIKSFIFSFKSFEDVQIWLLFGLNIVYFQRKWIRQG